MRDVRVGQTVVRMLGGEVPMDMKITAVTDTVIRCGAWTFDRDTGAEIDEDLGWGPENGVTGSILNFNTLKDPP